jgi:hypothetical protein
MRAVVVAGPTADDWHDGEIDGSLSGLQSIVGGHIEALPIDSDRATVFLNEEGKLIGLPATALWTTASGEVLDGLAGHLVILGPVDEEGDTLPLTDEALAYARQFVRPIIGPPSIRVISFE